MGGPWQWLVFLAAGGLGLVLLALAMAVFSVALTTEAAWRGRVLTAGVTGAGLVLVAVVGVCAAWTMLPELAPGGLLDSVSGGIVLFTVATAVAVGFLGGAAAGYVTHEGAGGGTHPAEYYPGEEERHRGGAGQR